MQRPQKTAKAGCLCEGMLETKSSKGACSIALTETDRKDGAENLLERILSNNSITLRISISDSTKAALLTKIGRAASLCARRRTFLTGESPESARQREGYS